MMGAQVCLDYGGRTNDQFLLHYGFVPHRNPSDRVKVLLPGHLSPVCLCTNATRADGSQHHISWLDLGEPLHKNVREAGDALLQSMPTSVEEDLNLLEEKAGEQALALQYRIGKKQLLRAIAGEQEAFDWFLEGLF